MTNIGDSNSFLSNFLGSIFSFLGAQKFSCSLGSFKCSGKSCRVCMNVTESNTFSSSVDKKEHVINHSFNCNDKCIIHLLTCNKCKI